MTSRYSNKFLKENLFFAIVQFVIGLVYLFLHPDGMIFSILWILIGSITTYKYLKLRKKYYLILDNDSLTVNWIFNSNRIEINSIDKIETFKNKKILKLKNATKKTVWTWMADDNKEEIFKNINQQLN